MRTKALIAGSALGLALLTGGVAFADQANDTQQTEQNTQQQKLAEKLGVSQEKLDTAMQEMHAEREAEHRTQLEERLATAVQEGKLTDSEKEAVLKAFDAGLLMGPGHGDKEGMGHGHGPRF